MTNLSLREWVNSLKQARFEIILLFILLFSVTIFYWLSVGNLDLEFIVFVLVTPAILFPLSFFFIRWIDTNQPTKEVLVQKLVELVRDRYGEAYRSKYRDRTCEGELGDEKCGVIDLAKLYHGGKYADMVEMMAHLIRESEVEFSRIIGLSVGEKRGNTFYELYDEGNCTGEMFSPIAYELGTNYTTLLAYQNRELNASDDELGVHQYGTIGYKDRVILVSGILTSGRATYQAATYLREQSVEVEHIFVYLIKPSGKKRDQVIEWLKEDGNLKVHYIAEVSEIYQKLGESNLIDEEELSRNLECLQK